LKTYDGRSSSSPTTVVRVAARNPIFEISPKASRISRHYEEYLDRLGDDHLDGEAVLRQHAPSRRRKRPRGTAPTWTTRAPAPQKDLAKRRDEVTAAVEKAESRIHEINELFCDPTFSIAPRATR